MHTLSLCMIVRNEEEVIDRCLSTIAPLVDEIIIVDTGSGDNTLSICYQYTDKIFHYTWHQDFAAARNFAFAQATGQYILWLDADDVVDPPAQQSLQALKARFSADVYLLQYDYAQDEYGQSTCMLYRERIVKNDGSFRWKYPVHEVIDGTLGRPCSYEQIVIRHARTSSGAAADAGRNLAILQQAVLAETYASDPRIWYYLGRELHDHQRHSEAIDAFKHFLSLPGGWHEERMMATFRVAQCYAADPAHADEARAYARKAMAQDDRWAEPFFVMGELAYHEKQYAEAIHWFRQCLRPLPPVLSPVNRELYGLRPNVYLVLCYDLLGQYEAAWACNENALQTRSRDAGLLYNRQYLAQQLTRANSIAWYTAPMLTARLPRWLQQHLQQLGVDNILTDDPLVLRRYSHLVFSGSCTAADHQVMQEMKQLGKKIFLYVTDNLMLHSNDCPFYLPMIRLADTVICCTHALAAQLAPWHAQVVVITAGVEPVTHHHQVIPTATLKAGWIGVPENAHYAAQWRPLLAQWGCRLETIHTGPDHDKYWTPDTWQYHLSQCDFLIAPPDTAAPCCTPDNQVITAMAMGLPVIAAPLDAYQRIIRDGWNGYIAANADAWQAAVLQLKDPLQRLALRARGYCTAMAFRPANIALQWWATLTPETYQQAAVDIIIPTIYDTPHLYHCIDSIRACTQIPYRIIVVHSGAHALSLPPAVKVVHAAAANFAAAINLGIAHSTAPYVCMMNDDVIVSDGWLQPLLHDVREGAGFANPLSNCDEGFLHHYPLAIGPVRLGPAVNKLHCGQLVHEADVNTGVDPSAVWNYHPGIQPRHYQRDWVPFFCTVTSRALIDAVGWLDDGFNNCWEDVDYCRRALALGYTAVVNEASFVFHFGGTSTEPYGALHTAEKEAGQQWFRDKYRAPLLCIHAGWAYEQWNAHTLQESGIGGSETAVAALAAAFAAEGYRVVVCCACDGKAGMIDGVEYLPLHAFQHFADRNVMDVFIISRYLPTLQYRVRAHKKYFWLHDVVALSGGMDTTALQQQLHLLDGVCCLSPWHRDVVAAHYQLPPEKLFLIGNGIDLSRFAQSSRKEVDRFIYSSSPDRGLDELLRLFPAIRKVMPQATLHIYYGFDNWEKSLQEGGTPAQQAFYNGIMEGMQQEGVFYHGRVDQQTLAAAFLASEYWLYPTAFTETYCITALEAQAARTLCICPPLAALQSTVGARGLLLEAAPGDAGFEQHVIATLTALRDDTGRKTALLDSAQAWACQQSWTAMARRWMAVFHPSAEVHHVRRNIEPVEH